NRINVSFGGFDLLKDVSFLIQHDDRIGLIGKNGAGKTTMLRLIAGFVQPSGGEVTIVKGTTFGYLPQEMKLNDTSTLINEAMLAFEQILAIEKEITKLNGEIAQEADYHSEDYLKKLDHLT